MRTVLVLAASATALAASALAQQPPSQQELQRLQQQLRQAADTLEQVERSLQEMMGGGAQAAAAPASTAQPSSASSGGGQAGLQPVRDALQEAADALGQGDADQARQSLERGYDHLRQAMDGAGEDQRETLAEVDESFKEAYRALEAQETDRAAEIVRQAASSIGQSGGSDQPRMAAQDAGSDPAQMATQDAGSDPAQPGAAPAAAEGGSTGEGSEGAQMAAQSEPARRGEAEAQASEQATASADAPSEPPAPDASQTAEAEPAEPVAIDPVRVGEAEVETEAQPEAAAAAGGLGQRPVSDILGRDLVNAAGDELGEIGDVALGPDDKVYLVVNVGGFLGLGQKEIPVPVEQLEVGGEDQLIWTTSMSEDELEEMAEIDDTYRPVEGEYVIGAE
jgi:sporulation protein YlmC with PRC-barrel domain